MSSKRKTSAMAVAGVGQDVDGSAVKKRKLTVDAESPENTSQVGLAFLNTIKVTRDKRNRLIATHFLTLPDRKRIPQYYQTIGLPMALDTIEGKLNRREFPTLTTLECDLRRMVSNAKSYNEKSSELFSDAEKIRKLVVSFMSQNNPAYETGTYTPYSTPVPPDWRAHLQPLEESHDLDADGETDPDEAVDPADPADPIDHHYSGHESFSAPAPNERRESSTPAVQDAEGAGESFEGNTFQQAQEKILTEMINLKNDDGESISTPFINLPSRDLRDYYRVIKHPVCLRSAQKAVKGIKGREKPTGATFMKSWQAFEDEISYVWNNARLYNEDGSEISILAGQLESYFSNRVAEAKQAVAEPPQAKVKLRMPARSPEINPKITLRFGAQKPGGPPGVSVDNEALQRQQDLVKAGANGRGAIISNESSRSGPQNPFGGSPAASGSIKVPPLHTASQDRARSASAEYPATTANGVKSEVSLGQSPALGAVQLSREFNRSSESTHSPNPGISAMGPPSSMNPHITSHSPHPPVAATNSHVQNAQPSATTSDPQRRQPGKDATDALISNLSISTDPGLKLDQHFHLDIPPSPTASHQSVTIHLPKTHNYLCIVPTIASHLVHRPTKIFVILGTQRLSAVPQRVEDTDPRRPLYEARVLPGVNRIEVEVIAGPARGAPKVGGGHDIELEKITVFVNVAKN